jgi:uncharacterized membrane protein YcaP (DUF421 family)
MYVSILIGVRVAGRRTLAQLSAFDAVITIALGSMFASTVVARDPSYAQGLTAVVTLLVLQIGLGSLRRRFAVVRRVVDFEPVPLIKDGVDQPRGGMLGAQITDDELLSALRVRGVFDRAAVELCILEPNGEVSVRRQKVRES